jgi:2-methylcitrate dehydratase PrpD
MNETRALARFVAETRFDDLPRGLVDNCKITVLDAIGAGFVGAVQPWRQRIVSVVRALGGAPEASVAFMLPSILFYPWGMSGPFSP